MPSVSRDADCAMAWIFISVLVARLCDFLGLTSCHYCNAAAWIQSCPIRYSGSTVRSDRRFRRFPASALADTGTLQAVIGAGQGRRRLATVLAIASVEP